MMLVVGATGEVLLEATAEVLVEEAEAEEVSLASTEEAVAEASTEDTALEIAEAILEAAPEVLGAAETMQARAATHTKSKERVIFIQRNKFRIKME